MCLGSWGDNLRKMYIWEFKQGLVQRFGKPTLGLITNFSFVFNYISSQHFSSYITNYVKLVTMLAGFKEKYTYFSLLFSIISCRRFIT